MAGSVSTATDMSPMLVPSSVSAMSRMRLYTGRNSGSLAKRRSMRAAGSSSASTVAPASVVCQYTGGGVVGRQKARPSTSTISGARTSSV